MRVSNQCTEIQGFDFCRTTQTFSWPVQTEHALNNMNLFWEIEIRYAGVVTCFSSPIFCIILLRFVNEGRISGFSFQQAFMTSYLNKKIEMKRNVTYMREICI